MDALTEKRELTGDVAIRKESGTQTFVQEGFKKPFPQLASWTARLKGPGRTGRFQEILTAAPEFRESGMCAGGNGRGAG